MNMEAIRITGPFKLDVIQQEAPACKDDEVLLKVRYVGFCGSDLNTFRGRNAMAKKDVIPGHEVGAEIAELGFRVPDTLKVGMTVTVDPYTACGNCPSCRNRRYNACEHNETLGVQRDGAMCGYIALPWQKIIPAEGISTMHCALIEPLSVGFHAVKRASVSDNETVVVFGCGMIGMGAIIRAALRGATVIAVDLDDEKLGIAQSVGAAHVINSGKEDAVEKVRELTGGAMAEVVVEAVGSPVTQRLAIECTCFTGRVVMIGYAKDDTSFCTRYFVQKELNIYGSRNAQPEDFRAVINYLRLGTCPFDKLISAVVRPGDAAEAMARWHDNPGKVFRILVEF